MTFHNEELTDNFQYVSGFGASFDTVVQEAKAGHEMRIQQGSQARHRFELQSVLQDSLEAHTLKHFGLARRGSWASFKVKDHSDFTSAIDGKSAPTAFDQPLGSGSGSGQRYQLFKVYGATSPSPYVRTIRLPVEGEVYVGIDGVPTFAFTVDANGVVTFDVAPTLGAVLTAGFEFRVPGRFEKSYEEWMRLDATAFDRWDSKSLSIIEVLDEVVWPDIRPASGAKYHVPADKSISITFADGGLHVIQATADIDVFLPEPEQVPPGDELFTVILLSTSTNSIQMRDDAGGAVGTAISVSGSNVVSRYGLYTTSTTRVWVKTS